jgi:hypothetical protein
MADSAQNRPTEGEALAAVRTLIEWAGDDPDREGHRRHPSQGPGSLRELFNPNTDQRDAMPKTYDHVTERLLRLRPGASCVVNRPRISFQCLRKHDPSGHWSAESRDGGLVVTRVR